MLLHFNGTDGQTSAMDWSNSEHDITFSGSAELDTDVTPKFGTAALLLGDNNYVTAADSADFDLGGGDFTIDCQVRLGSVGGNEYLWGRQDDDNNRYYLRWTGSNWQLIVVDTGSVVVNTTFSDSISTNTWYHVALLRDGTDYKLYRDGTLKGTTSDSDNFPDLSSGFDIGRANSGAGVFDYMNGHIDEFRILKGKADVPPVGGPTQEYKNAAVSSSSSSSSSSPTKSSSSSSSEITEGDMVLLLHYNGDDAATDTRDWSNSEHPITFVGTAQLDTAQKVFGTASLLLDGNSDYNTAPDSDDWYFADNDFTIDMRVRFSTVQTCVLMTQWSATGRSFQLLYDDGGNNLKFIWSTNGTGESGSKTESWSPAQDTWYHIAVVRNSDELYMFVDGTELGTSTSITDTLFNSDELLYIGCEQGTGNFMAGWIDELRMLNGSGVWTSNFTPPTQEYKNAAASSSSST